MTYWANVVVFTAPNAVYPVTIDDCFLFINSNSQANCTIMLPSGVRIGKGYIVKETSDTVNQVIVKTDNANCQVDGGVSAIINTSRGSFNFIMGPDGHYWLITGDEKFLGFYTNTAQLQANYPNNSQLSSNLANYETTSALNSTLSNYVTSSGLSSTLASYQTTGSYVTVADLTAILASYVTAAQLSSNLVNYVHI